MVSDRVITQNRVLAELAALGPDLAALGPRPAPDSIDKLELMAQIREVACFVDRAQGQLARLVGVLDAISGASEAGYSSAVAFLRHACGRAPARAGELVATGRALRTLKATGQALLTGGISFDAAHVICRAIVQIADPGVAEVAEQRMLAYAHAGRAGASSPDVGGEPGSAGTEAGTGPEPGTGPSAEAGPSAGPASGADPAAGPEPAAADSDGGRPGPNPAGPRPWITPGLDPSQLRTVGEDLIHRADPERADEHERKRFERRHLSFGYTMDDVGTITAACGGRLSLEIIKTAVNAFGPPSAGTTPAPRPSAGWTA